MIAQSGDLGVAGYVTQSFAEGAIGYVNYSYALGAQFPVAKVLNAAGYYTEPTPRERGRVAAEGADQHRRRAPTTTSPSSSTASTPTPTPATTSCRRTRTSSCRPRSQGQFNEAKGRTLGAFAYYAMCQAQQQSASLGYSPMPINLVQASFDADPARSPGVEVQNINIQECKNPTFSPDGTNLLAKNAPFPPDCDKAGPDPVRDGHRRREVGRTRRRGRGDRRRRRR